MLYAELDTRGKISALHGEPGAGREETRADDPAVIAFLASADASDGALQYLVSTDEALPRVIEDLVNLLVEKNVIMFTELPDAVQRKLEIRSQARENLRGGSVLVVDPDDIL